MPDEPKQPNADNFDDDAFAYDDEMIGSSLKLNPTDNERRDSPIENPGASNLPSSPPDQPAHQPAVDPDDAISEMPTVAPASGWLDSHVAMNPADAHTDAGPASDVLHFELSKGESDVIRGLTEPTSGQSGIFDDAQIGSARFEHPDDATEDGSRPLGEPEADADRDHIFGLPDLPENAAETSSRMPRPPEYADEGDQGRLDFNQIDPTGSGSAVYYDSPINELFSESGVNLFSPEGPSGILGAGSGIFEGAIPVSGPDSGIPLNLPPAELPDGSDSSDHDALEEVEQNSNVFDSDSSTELNDDEIDFSGTFPASEEGNSSAASGLPGFSDHNRQDAAAAVPPVQPVSLNIEPTKTGTPDPAAEPDEVDFSSVFPASEEGNSSAASGLPGFSDHNRQDAAAAVPPVQPVSLNIEPTKTGTPDPAAEPDEVDFSSVFPASEGNSSAASGLPGFSDHARPKPVQQSAEWDEVTPEPVVDAFEEVAEADAFEEVAEADALEEVKAVTEVPFDAVDAVDDDFPAEASTIDAVDDDELAESLPPTRTFDPSGERAAPRTEARPTKTATKKSTGGIGWIAGGALGLLLGAGASAGVFFSGVLGDKPVASNPAALPIPVANSTELAEARQANSDLQSKLAGATTAAEQATQATNDLQQRMMTTMRQLTEAEANLETVEAAATAAKKAAEKAMTELAAAKSAAEKATTDLTAAQTTLTTLEKEKVATTEELTLANTKLKAAMTQAATALGEKAAVMKDLDAAKKITEARMQEVTALESKLAATTEKFTAADKSLNQVIAELKANKLVDEKAEPAAILAKLPEVMKQAAAAASSTDAKKAAEVLAAAQKELTGAKAELAKATKDYAALQADAEKAKQAADKLVLAQQAETKAALAKLDAEVKKATDAATKEAAVTIAKLNESVKTAQAETLTAKNATDTALAKLDAEVKKATDAATKDAAATIAKLNENLKAAQAETLAEKKAGETRLLAKQQEQQTALAAADERHRRQLEEVRSTKSILPLTNVEEAAHDRSEADYARGITNFFAGRYAEAERAFTQAAAQHPGDARYWYFLGLSQTLQGQSGEAAFKRGAQYEAGGRPASRKVDAALERIQGAVRAELNQYRR